jgi:hypothetical protein
MRRLKLRERSASFRSASGFPQAFRIRPIPAAPTIAAIVKNTMSEATTVISGVTSS